MGLLDDAIREHLELKRRRGAEPGEVTRQEREALGPVRPLEPDAEYSDAPAAAPEPPAPAGPPVYEIPSAAPPEPVVEAPVAPAPEAPPLPPVHAPDPEPVAETPAAPPPPAPAPTAAPREPVYEIPSRASTSEQTVEWSIDDMDMDSEVIEPDEEPDADDVLDQTPDFLQETPEHDRLWFEQKPPKPFDFEP